MSNHNQTSTHDKNRDSFRTGISSAYEKDPALRVRRSEARVRESDDASRHTRRSPNNNHSTERDISPSRGLSRLDRLVQHRQAYNRLPPSKQTQTYDSRSCVSSSSEPSLSMSDAFTKSADNNIRNIQLKPTTASRKSRSGSPNSSDAAAPGTKRSACASDDPPTRKQRKSYLDPASLQRQHIDRQLPIEANSKESLKSSHARHRQSKRQPPPASAYVDSVPNLVDKGQPIPDDGIRQSLETSKPRSTARKGPSENMRRFEQPARPEPQPIVPQNPHKMFLQPLLSPVTQEQLAAEVKGIYAGLVMVEAKSINIDAEQSADRTKPLSAEQWQQLIALRRTLLYEHHDFLMATQHPVANPALRALAAKYCMPARMWKHGIHGFLEVLRHRRPESQEYMLTFIYLAYDMMALLFETVPAFTDTWIECLGDLARYRMAIEEDKEVHAIWGGVAGRWYTMASNRHPQIGRLYHHLGILERPSLRKLYFYGRSLTSVVPFINARESLGTLCAPILQDDQAIRSGPHSAEAMTICYHARVFSGENQTLLERDGKEALDLLQAQPAGKISSYAAPLAVTNIASLFEFGLSNNVFRQMFSAELARAAHNARPSTTSTVAISDAAKAINESEAFGMTTYPSVFVIDFMVGCFNKLIRRPLDHGTVRDLLQYVHVNLVFFRALLDLRLSLTIEGQIAVVEKILLSVDWPCLAVFLNELIKIDPISTRIEEHALFNQFLLPERAEERKPLAEDFMIRGMIWAEGYLPAELFLDLEDDDGSRALETPARLHLRAERVEWLACSIANHARSSPLSYDRSLRQYNTRQLGPLPSRHLDTTTHSSSSQQQHGASPHSTCSATMSGASSTAEDYDMMSLQSESRSQAAASLEPRPSVTSDDTYVHVAPARASTRQKQPTHDDDEGDASAVMIVDADSTTY